MDYLVSIYRIASDTPLDVRVGSEAEAEHLIYLMNAEELDYAELYRVHAVPEGDNPYELLRTI